MTTGCCRGLSVKDCIARPYGCFDGPPKRQIWELWVDGMKVREFASLEATLKEIGLQNISAPFGIKLPDGSWYEWENNEAIF